MPTHARVAVVTGGNKGVGYACVRQLALRYPQSILNNGPLLIYLTSRDRDRGEQAVKDILEDPKLKSAKALRQDGGLTDVQLLSLDIDDVQSIKELAATLNQGHPDGIDILINNAGVAMDGFDAGVVKKTLHCNYYGTFEATRRLLPLLRNEGRLVNVASRSGLIDSQYAAPIRKRFLEAETVDQVTKLMKEFEAAVSEDTYRGIWPGAAYKVSKAGEIGMTKCIAEEHSRNGGKVLINSCHPGYVNTDMTKGKGTLSPDQGAETPLLLALGDINGVSGKYWANGKIESWSD